ncbi:MAG: valine--tRNA ligase [Elusimicrobia bacterium]|nr:valine--tRNA ligase [Elusimicrobiota bacterium]
MLDKVYTSRPVEEKWSASWRAADLFHGEPRSGTKPFVMVIPPPNVTGALHVGHALDNTLQDIFARWQRLLGRPVCWVPGTDHGGIATQSVMEKQLKAEKLTRQMLGREKFLARMQAWTRQCKSTILGQLERLGCALDWRREAFTMDADRADAVHEAFKVLWEKGLVYRGERMVNWCVRCGTALSDIEVEFEERKGHLWHIHYPAADGGRGPVVATTRPETMLGDTAVAVNPKDPRYQDLVGKTLRLPLAGRDIPVVADEYVDSGFGTGALKVTPAHDPNDFEIGQRHKLASVAVISPDGHMTAAAGSAYAGLSREAAREKVVEDLKAAGVLEKVADYPHSVGVCYRCNQPIEPMLSWQWFVRMEELAKPAAVALDSGRFRLYPESWAKPYRDWLSNIRDWCISRQIWWGHRIPVWYCVQCHGERIRTDFHQVAAARGVLSVEAPGSCPVCGGAEFVRDPDVLDTWFSSALWPFSVFRWPGRTAELKFFYPTSLLVTGYEILYLWVARMQMMGLALMGEAPFPECLIHGIVRDKHGKKMSKSLGNVVDPLVMMDKYGTDAFRFSLVIQAHPGKDIPFAESSITGSRNFANKLWNSTRFVLMNLPPAGRKAYRVADLDRARLELCDRWILAEYQATLSLVRQKLDAYDPAAAADALYGFLWDKFCDWYVELAKIRLQGQGAGRMEVRPAGAGGTSATAGGPDQESARAVLVEVLSGTLRMLHPFMPFITEELHGALKPFNGVKAGFIVEAGAPELSGDWSDDEACREMGTVMEVVAALRSLRAQLNVPPGLRIDVVSAGGSADVRELLAKRAGYLTALAHLRDIRHSREGTRPPHSATAVAAGMSFYVPLEGVIDLAQECGRLRKEIAKAEADLSKLAVKMENKDFLARAPQAEVELARRQYDAARGRLDLLGETLRMLS